MPTKAELAAELNTDPKSLGYAPLITSGDHPGLADLLNLTRPTIAIKRANCTPAEILEAIDIRDFLASPAGVTSIPMAQSWLESVTQFPSLRLATDAGAKTLTRKNLDRLVGDTQGSQTRLDAVAVRAGSRAEELWGSGTRIEYWDVARALQS